MLPDEAYIDDMSASPTLCSPKDSSDSLPTDMFCAGSNDYPGCQVVTELIHTERKYVQDLETMQVRCHPPRSTDQRVLTRHTQQEYATTAIQTNTIDQDTIHLLFPNLNKLLNFQRKFLIKLESIWELPWNERQWGQPFTEFVRACFQSARPS